MTRSAFSPLCLALIASLASQAANATEAARQPTITVLYDAFGRLPDLRKDWGYSALIEVDGKRILFDTGNNPDVLEATKAVKVDLSYLDFVVMSHRRGDHMGRMAYLLKANSHLASLPSKFYRKNETLPADMRQSAVLRPILWSLAAPGRARTSNWSTRPRRSHRAFTYSLISKTPGTLELKELTLAIRTPNGLLLVVGCSQPGLDKLIAASQSIDPHIHLLVGGFHLIAASDEVLAKAVTLLHDSAKVDYIAPGHCTGEPAFAALERAFGDRYLYAGLGTTIGLKTRPSP